MALNPKVLGAWPPGGWQFYQPETDWHAPFPLQFNFDGQVKNMMAMRSANPAKGLDASQASCAADLEAYTEVRLAKTYSRAGMKKFLSGPPPTPELKKKAWNGTLPGRNESSAGAGRAGIDPEALLDWLGSGGTPVLRELAEKRATICATCQANQKVGWMQMLTRSAALVLRKYISIKHRLSLHTPSDDALGTCQACKCALQLKVWVPMPHIRDNTSLETLGKHQAANPSCWVLTEQ